MKAPNTTLTSIALIALASAASAQDWHEHVNGGGDAVQLPPGQNTVGSGPLASLSGVMDVTEDVDTFLIRICCPTLFSATTSGGLPVWNSQLFLFFGPGHPTPMGVGIAANDDSPVGGEPPQSRIPVGALTTSLTPGLYLIAISANDSDPLDVNGEIFPDLPLNGVHPPNAGSGPVTGWSPGALPPSGAYTITLTGVCFACALPPEVITLRSGQVSGAPGDPCDLDTNITCDAGAVCRDGLSLSFSPLPVPSARIIASVAPPWIASLPCDPEARWINWEADSMFFCRGYPGRSVLYAHPFTVTTANVGETTISFCWAADDSLGDPVPGPWPDGVYINNGTSIIFVTEVRGGGFSAQSSVTISLPPGTLRQGNNVLYVYQRDTGCDASGVIYSATISIMRCPSPCPDDGINVDVLTADPARIGMPWNAYLTIGAAHIPKHGAFPGSYP